MIPLPLRLLTALSAFTLAAASASAETSLLLDVGFGIRYVPPSHVTVPAGELLRISAPDVGPVQWTKDGRPIPNATEPTLVVSVVSDRDAGTYVAVYDTGTAGQTSQSLVLAVGPTQRLTNLSTRAQVGGGEKTFIAGFVVTGAQHKKIILRAVGPTLAQFGVKEPVAQPAIAIFDQHGRPYTNAYVYPPVVGGLTYEVDLAQSLVKAGAYPLPPGSRDVVEMRPFLPGSYSVHVTSADGTPGIVLFELYEVP